MFTIKTSQLKETCAILRRAHKPFMVVGTYGIGKSQMLEQEAMEEAERSGRIYLDWNRESLAVKQDAMAHPEKYFMFVDIRISQLDEGDLRGIPVIGNAVSLDREAELKLVTLGWVNYITKQGAAGTVFFDELNLAKPAVTAAAYSIINDRIISDRSISPNIFIVAAGNLESDCDLVQPIAEPLQDRFCMAQLELDKKYWLDWAAENINPYLFAFCKWDQDYIHRPAKVGSDVKAITPRGIANASKVLEQVDFSNETAVHTALSLCVGLDFSNRFLAYYKHVQAINWDKLKEDPASVKELDTERQFAIMGAAVSKVKEACAQSASLGEVLSQCFVPINVLTYMGADFMMASLKQFVKIYPTYIEKNKAAAAKDKQPSISLHNILLKMFMLGSTAFLKTHPEIKAPVMKGYVNDLCEGFKDRHLKVFMQLSKHLSK